MWGEPRWHVYLIDGTYELFRHYYALPSARDENGREVARATPPRVEAIDGTAAGDSFAACLVVSLLEGRPRDEALVRACAAGALAASRLGAQPSLPAARPKNRRKARACLQTDSSPPRRGAGTP